MEYSEAKQKKPGDSMLPNNVGNQSDQQDNALVYTNDISAHDNAADNPDRIVPEQEKVPYKVKGLESLQKLDKNYKRKYFSNVGGKKDIENFTNSYGKVQQAYEGEIEGLMMKGKKNKKLLGDQCGYIAQIYARLRYAKTTDWTSSNKFKNAYKNFETFLKNLEDDDPKKTLEDLKKAKDSAEEYKTGHNHSDKNDRNEVSTTQRNTLLKVNTMGDICQLYKSYSDKYDLYTKKIANDEFSNSGFLNALEEHITDEDDKKLTETYEELGGPDFNPLGKKSTIKKQGMDSPYYSGNGHYTENGAPLPQRIHDKDFKNPGSSIQRLLENLGISGADMKRNVSNGFITGDNCIMNLFGVVKRENAEYPDLKHGTIRSSAADEKDTILDEESVDYFPFFGGVSGAMCPEGMKKEDYEKLCYNGSEEDYEELMEATIKSRDEANKKDLSYRQIPIYKSDGTTEKIALDYKCSTKKDIIKKFNLGPFEKYFDDKFFNKDAFKVSELGLISSKKVKIEIYKPIWYIMFNAPHEVEKITQNTHFSNCLKFIHYIQLMYSLMEIFINHATNVKKGEEADKLRAKTKAQKNKKGASNAK